jgi:hypothetical protein
MKSLAACLVLASCALCQTDPVIDVKPGPQAIKDKDLWEKSGWIHPFRRMPGYILHDQKAIWTSPFHINGGNAKWWGLFAVGTAALIATDRTTERSLGPSVTRNAFSANVSQIGAEYTTLPIAAGLYLYGRKVDNPKAREVGVLGAEALLDSAITVEIMKKMFGRERPDLAGGNGRFFKGKDGFPSGCHGNPVLLPDFEYGPSKSPR